NAGKVQASVNLREQLTGWRDLHVKFECTAAVAEKSGLNSLKVGTIFQYNMQARPFLVNGPNKVTVRAGNPQLLKDEKFQVAFSWMEGGKTQRQVEKVAKARGEYTITVAGPKDELPKMVSLELMNEP